MALLLSIFVNAQCLTAVVAVLSWAFAILARGVQLSAPAQLRVHYALMGLFGMLLLSPILQRDPFQFHPVAHVDAGSVAGDVARGVPAPVMRLPGETVRSPGLPLGSFATLAAALLLCGAAASLVEYVRLSRLLKRATTYRRIGRVRVAVAEGLASPLAARTWGALWVIVPPATLGDPLSLKVAVAHELQHHRNGDTLWCHAFVCLRTLCFFHPLRAPWAAVVAEAQELACDEVLVEQKRRVSAGDYARCLVRAAELAAREGEGRAYAAAPGLSSARRMLARRIETMYAKKKKNRWLATVLGLVAGVTLAAGAWASGQWVVDTRITAEKMNEMAAVARQGTDFPIQVNELVLRELNYYLGTAKGREFVGKAKAGLAAMRPLLDREVGEHGVPEELLAVAFTESGFQNLPQEENHSSHGAGVWQFIPSTARNFGLRVDGQTDERLDVDRETDAAFRYLEANQLRYQDWLLGIMAYNMGEHALDAAIQKTGVRDPWQLMRLGYGGDFDYLARVMAGVLILKSNEAYR